MLLLNCWLFGLHDWFCLLDIAFPVLSGSLFVHAFILAILVYAYFCCFMCYYFYCVDDFVGCDLVGFVYWFRLVVAGCSCFDCWRTLMLSLWLYIYLFFFRFYFLIITLRY